jgi:hypothetical protein
MLRSLDFFGVYPDMGTIGAAERADPFMPDPVDDESRSQPSYPNWSTICPNLNISKTLFRNRWSPTLPRR